MARLRCIGAVAGMIAGLNSIAGLDLGGPRPHEQSRENEVLP